MKHFSSIVLAFALTVPACAQVAGFNGNSTNPIIPVVVSNKIVVPTAADIQALEQFQALGQLLPASAAALTAPLVLTNGYFFLDSEQAEVATGGRAVFNFSITNAGNYVIEALANAPDESSNSFFLNIDATPTDEMIWDLDVTSGFEKRVADWRGTGDSSNDEFAPKIFKLEPGDHKLIIVGREPGTQLKSLTIRPTLLQPAAPVATPTMP